jgi:uncharacterized UPF0146 family protein
MTKPKILVLGAGFYYVNILKQLREGGFYVLSVDINPEAIGKNFSDIFSCIDIKDKISVLDFAVKNKID